MKQADSVFNIRESDLTDKPGDLPDWGQRLLEPLNRTLSDLQRRTLGGSLFDNLKCDIISARFINGTTLRVKLSKLQAAGSGILLRAATAVALLKVVPASSGYADVTVTFADSSVIAADVTCVLLADGLERTSGGATLAAATVAPATGAWQTLSGPFGSDVALASSPVLPPRYRKDATGRVTVQGTFTFASPASPGHTLFTLPVGYRGLTQATVWNVDVSDSAYPTWARVDASGVVSVADFSGAQYPVNCTVDLSFFAG